MTQENKPTFANADRRAKLAGQIARLIRRYRLDYAAFETVCKAARKETGPGGRRDRGACPACSRKTHCARFTRP